MGDVVPDCDDDALIAAAHILSRGEAMVAAAALRSEGIPVFVGGEAHLSLTPLSVALGGHRIMAPASAWSAASDVLRALPGTRPPKH